jgi:hypothetical protein
MAFDTLSSVKILTAAGMPETQAEAVTTLLREAHEATLGTLATKTDLAEAKADILLATKADLAETKADILKWMIGMIGGAVVVNAMTVIGAMLALIRLVGH